MGFGCVLTAPARAAQTETANRVQLELRPRVCTLSGNDKQCSTTVHASWRSPEEESLCLVIVERADVKQCWDHYSRGTYSVELVFAEDLLFELRDLQLQNVLATKALKVIREALELRHKRRQPWNLIF